MEILKGLGGLLAAYGCYWLLTGSVWAKDGISSREVFKAEQPLQFWIVCLCYILAGGMIFFIP